MNSQVNKTNAKTNTTLQIVLLSVACLWLIILLFSNYYSYSMEYQGKTLKCQLKYDGNTRCKYQNTVLFKQKISGDDCYDKYVCNSILAAFPITIIVVILIGITITLILLKKSTLPGYTRTFNQISITLVGVSGILLFVISIILMTAINEYSLEVWLIVSQFLISLILFVSLVFIRREEQQETEIIKQEQSNNVEIKQYLVQ